jgi:hypothetical protein
MLSLCYHDWCCLVDCHCAECHDALCSFAECHCDKCRYAECHFALCCFVECRGTNDFMTLGHFIKIKADTETLESNHRHLK